MTAPIISRARVELAAAERFHARTVELSVDDLEQLVRLAESGDDRERADDAKKHAGRAKPGSLQSLRGGRKLFTRLSRRRSDEFCVEVFFSGRLREAGL